MLTQKSTILQTTQSVGHSPITQPDHGSSGGIKSTNQIALTITLTLIGPDGTYLLKQKVNENSSRDLVDPIDSDRGSSGGTVT